MKAKFKAESYVEGIRTEIYHLEDGRFQVLKYDDDGVLVTEVFFCDLYEAAVELLK